MYAALKGDEDAMIKMGSWEVVIIPDDSAMVQTQTPRRDDSKAHIVDFKTNSLFTGYYSCGAPPRTSTPSDPPPKTPSHILCKHFPDHRGSIR